MVINRYTLSFVALLLITSLPCTGQSLKTEKNFSVAMRMIGHRILLTTGDTTSRVLPIHLEGNQYRIRFESEFEIQPDDIIRTIKEVIDETNLTSQYAVEVEQNNSGAILHSYTIGSNFDKDMITCQERKLPKDCYSILFTNLSPPINTVPAEDVDIAGSAGIVLVAIILAFCWYFYYLSKRKTDEDESNIIELGQYQFDKHNMKLGFGQNQTDLSHKEADLLSLLYSSVNQTIGRDYIQKIVWGNDGSYIGRTLDVFISKLRKKLANDPNIKIINVRGVGYRLVLNN